MGTVPNRWDHAVAWVADPNSGSSLNQKPVFLSDYVDALEALVRSGDSGPDDLSRLRARMGLPDTPSRSVTDAAINAAIPPVASEMKINFISHRWEGWESGVEAYCANCGALSNSIQSMKECEPR